MEHVKELLSAYIDKALAADQTARVDAHLAACPACREELADVKRISRLVSSLPSKELPSGFHERLARKRREAEGESGATLPWFPSPLRTAAFAAAGLFMTLTVYHEAKLKLSNVASLNELQSGASVAHYDEESAERAAYFRASSRRDLDKKAPGRPLNVAEEPQPAPPAAPADSLEQYSEARLKQQAYSQNLVAGVAQEKFTNERQQDFLEQDKKKLGIREIIPQGASAPRAETAAKDMPMNKEEARAIMREMTAQLAQVNQAKQARTAPAVPLSPGAAPQLLANGKTGYAFGGAGAVGSASGGAAQGSLSMVKGEGVDVSVPASAVAPETGPVAAPGKYLAKRKADYAPKIALKPAVKKARFSWSGTTGGLSGPGGAKFINPADWADFWRRVGSEPPPLDFDQSMAVAVFGAPSGGSVKIMSAGEKDGKFLVRYRSVAGASDASTETSTAYHVLIVPRSDLPIAFEQVP